MAELTPTQQPHTFFGHGRKPKNGTNQRNINRPASPRIPPPVCIHRGERLTLAEGKQHEAALLQLGVKCNTCSGKRHEFHCSKHQFTNAGKCRECLDFTPPT